MQDERINVLGDDAKANLINELQKEKTETVVLEDGKTTEVQVQDLDPKEIQKQSLEKHNKAYNLPEVGTEFSINGQIFKITYVNEGRKRLSAEPVV